MSDPEQLHVQVSMTPDEVREMIRQTVRETFTTLGVQVNDPIEVQKDFQHLRDWRVTTDSIKKKGILTMVGLLITGAAAAVWLGLKSLMSQ
jgi:hypothetical protein